MNKKPMTTRPDPGTTDAVIIATANATAMRTGNGRRCDGGRTNTASAPRDPGWSPPARISAARTTLLPRGVYSPIRSPTPAVAGWVGEETAYDGGFGRLAQLGERLPYKQEVGGSIPSPPMAQRSHLRRGLASGEAALASRLASTRPRIGSCEGSGCHWRALGASGRYCRQLRSRVPNFVAAKR